MVDSAEKLEMLIERVKKLRRFIQHSLRNKWMQFFKAAATAADKARIPLARMAVEETGMGVLEDKIIKNHFASEYIYNKHKNVKTCGIIKEDKANGIKTVAEPLGVIAGIVPTTNPTSTAIFKSLIALKTRNAIIFSPHPRATNVQLKLLKSCWKLLLKRNTKHKLEADYEHLKKNIETYFRAGGTGESITVEINNFLREHFLLNGDPRNAEIKLTGGGELTEILRLLDLVMEGNKSGLGTLNLLCIAAEMLLFNNQKKGLKLALVEELRHIFILNTS